MSLTLFSYYRSSAAYRVRIALNLKGVSYTIVPVNLLAGEQRAAEYLRINPQGLVPALALADGRILTQSGAILEWLESCHPQPPLLPADPYQCARVRSLCNTVACDVHPLNNLRVLGYLGREFGATQEQKDTWYRHWVREGLLAVEKLLAGDPRTGAFCHRDTPGLADCCLVPQVFNARRFNCPLDDMPTIRRVVEACEQLPAFRSAAPAAQPDAE